MITNSPFESLELIHVVKTVIRETTEQIKEVLFYLFWSETASYFSIPLKEILFVIEGVSTFLFHQQYRQSVVLVVCDLHALHRLPRPHVTARCSSGTRKIKIDVTTNKLAKRTVLASFVHVILCFYCFCSPSDDLVCSAPLPHS